MRVLRLHETMNRTRLTPLVQDIPLMRQLTNEAGLHGTIYITPQEYDAVLTVAGKYGLWIEVSYKE